MPPFSPCPMLNVFEVRLCWLAKKSSLRARCRCSHWQSSTLDPGDGGVRHMHTSLAEATLFRKHRNQNAMCFNAHRLRFWGTRQATKSCLILSLAQRSQLQMAPHFSQPELALVRGWQSEGWAAKEMWELHRADRRGRDIQPVCFSAFKEHLWDICVDRASEVHKISYVRRAQKTSKTHKT